MLWVSVMLEDPAWGKEVCIQDFTVHDLMCLLEHGDFAGTAGFQPITLWCVANGILGNCGPNFLHIINNLAQQSSIGMIRHLSLSLSFFHSLSAI